VWFKHDDAELEPLEEEVDFIITTSEELLSILPNSY
ncbi:HAD family hydrolase, partial [Staphylococcus aureus]